MPTYLLLLFENDDFQEVDSKWDGIPLSLTKNPSDDILDGLYKSRIRVSQKLKTALKLYDLEVHQKKARPDHHRLKKMVKRKKKQDSRNKNFGARNGNYERNAVVKNQGTKQRGQRTLGDCWQWEANGQCSKGDNCSFRHDVNKRAKMTQPNQSPSSFMQQNERNASRTRKIYSFRSQFSAVGDVLFTGTLSLQSLISNFFNADCKCFLFGMLVNFFPSRTFSFQVLITATLDSFHNFHLKLLREK